MAPGCCHLADPHSDRFQFSLRELLALTTFTAIAAAVAAVKGPGVFVAVAGLGACYLNYRGALARWQDGKYPWLLVGVSCVVFGISLGLPAVMPRGRGFTQSGWWAAQYALSFTTDRITEKFNSFASVTNYLQYSLFNLANLLFVLSPFWVWRLSTGHGNLYGTLGAISAAAVWCAWNCWLEVLQTPAYYVWALASLTLLSAWRIRRFALIAMAITTAFFIAVA